MKTLRITTWTAFALLGFVALGAAPAAADICHLDDVIIDGSLCVGIDCVCNESFGFDTIRLKENNLRIHFDDTSTAASFPPNDWRIVINDSANGGDSYFGIDDATAGRRVFEIEAGARTNALTVDSQGDIGIGLQNAAVDLHVKTGNTPTLRLEQDGTSGFSPQTWDVAGNEANFFIRDVTSGSTLPIRLRPGAPTSALDITAAGDLGIGTSSPAEEIAVVRSDADDVFLNLQSTNGTAQNTGIAMANSADFFTNFVDGSGNFVISTDAGSPVGVELEINGSTGDVTIGSDLTVEGDLFVNGAGMCTGCDEVFQPGYPVESIEEHAELMWQNSYLPAVGPSRLEEPINVFQKTAGILNELEKAHIYIEQLHERLRTTEEMGRGQQQLIDELMARLEALER